MIKFLNLHAYSKRSSAYFFVGLLLTLSLLWPLFVSDYFSHHDDVQIIRLHQMDKCIKDGQLPCRWVPDLGGLYGYPLFNYYAPLPYYYGEIFYLLTGSLIISAKIMFATSFVGSFIFMYLLGRKLWGEMGGSLSAVFYSFAPYHAVDFYVRGAMGELWGLMFFPAIIWAILRLYEKRNVLNTVLLSILTSFLMISHNLSTMVFMPFAIIFTGVLLLHKKNLFFLWTSMAAFVLAVAMSSFYLLPALLEKDLVHVDTTTVGYFSYTEHFKGLKKVLFDREWGWGGSIREVPGGEKDGMSFQVGWIHLLGFLIALGFTIKYFKKEKFTFKILTLLTIAFVISIFMIHPRSQFIWDLVKPLKYLQFPWRFLMLTIFVTSLGAGAIFVFVKNHKYEKVFWYLLVIMVVLFNFSYFRPEKFISTSDQELLTGENWDKQIKRSIYDYLPIYAKEPPRDLATVRYQILTGDITITDFKEGSNWIKFKADAKTHSIVRLSQYYFPDWKITIDGKEVPIDYKNNTLGLMTFIIGAGEHTVEARLYDTQIRTLGNFISSLGFGVIVLLILLQSSRFKKLIAYYVKRIR